MGKSTIYNWIKKCSPRYKDNIHRHLRHGGRKKKKNNAVEKVLIPNRKTIDECPFEDYGMAIGDWETDTIVGKNGKGAILTLVDKKAAF